MPPATRPPFFVSCATKVKPQRPQLTSPDDPRLASRELRANLARGLPCRARRNRTPRRAARCRGSGGAVDARCEPRQVASRPYHLVLRAIPAGRRISRDIASSMSSFAYLFNSYYVAAGPRHARPKARPPHAAGLSASRGLPCPCRCGGRAASRRRRESRAGARSLRILEIGLHHEQQHQELLLTDILHAFAQNPVAPAYDADWQAPRGAIIVARIRRIAVRHSHHRLCRRRILLRQRAAGAPGLSAAGAHRARRS